jgi:hypothetical protein
MRIIILLLLTVCVRLSYAQQQNISGALKTPGGTAISFASVMLKDSQNKVIAFKSTDAKGYFTLAIPASQDRSSLHLEINHLGFKKVNEALEEGKNHYEILMEEQAINLADVQVKSRPRLTNIGDTLSYDVGSFAKNEDRSIEDVIKRLPGMEVNEDGKIKFNGQDISNLYIDGDDLLDDKYAIGTKTIPYAMVQGVEVLQNHQPLKVLKNKVLSDKIAINLVIKEEAKLNLTGQAKIGAGLPNQYDSELNSILFNKKYKMLNVLKGNNIGNDLSSDFSGFNFSSMMGGMGNSRPSSLLSTGTAGNPGLPRNRYFLNHSGSLNANNLMNHKSGLQLKSNIKLLVDKNEKNYSSLTEYYSEQDTIRYNEQQNLENHPFITDLSFNAQLNKETYYFNNALNFTYSKETSHSSLFSNETDIKQKLQDKVRDFTNTLDYVPQLRNKNILSFNWYLNYYSQPQTLFIQPGINTDIFNEGNPFSALNQFAETPTWFNRATLGYRLTKGIIKQNYRLGMLNEFQQLNSQLRLTQLDGSETDYHASADNHLNWNRNQFFVDGSYEYKRGPLESILFVPLALQRIAYENKDFDLKEQKNQLLVNPSLKMKYMTGVEDYLSFNYNYSNRTGNINSVFQGAVLSNYRSLRANDAVLEEQNSHAVGINYNFRRSLSMLFMNAGFSYNRASANTISSNVIANNISQTVLLSMVNQVNSFGANVGISKYIFALGATTNLKASWNSRQFNQLFNGELLPFTNLSFSLNPSIEARLWNRISMTYSGDISWMTSQLASEAADAAFPDRQIQNMDQSVGLSYSPFKSTFLRLSGRHQYSKQPESQVVNYFFVDANARYKINKWRTDVELDLSNLANITSFETYNISANRFVFSRYQLRGRMAVLRFVFNL